MEHPLKDRPRISTIAVAFCHGYCPMSQQLFIGYICAVLSWKVSAVTLYWCSYAGDLLFIFPRNWTKILMKPIPAIGTLNLSDAVNRCAL